MIYEILIDEDMVIPSPYCINDEYWIIPFVIKISDEVPLDMDMNHYFITDDHRMQLLHSVFEDFGSSICNEISWDSIELFLLALRQVWGVIYRVPLQVLI